MSPPSPLPPPTAPPDQQLVASDQDATVTNALPQRMVRNASTKPNRHSRKLVHQDDFDAIGVRPNESRVAVIRGAVHQAASDLADRLHDPATLNVDEEITRFAMATYRVLDPRARRNRHQSAMVGRIMPNALTHAAGQPWGSLGDVPSVIPGRPKENAFIRVLATVSDEPQVPTQDATDGQSHSSPPATPRSSPITLEMFSAAVMASDFAANSEQRVRTKRSIRTPDLARSAPLSPFRRWSHHPRFVLGLTIAVMMATLFLAVWTIQLQRTRSIVRGRAATPLKPSIAPELPLEVPETKSTIDLESELAEHRVSATPSVASNTRSAAVTTPDAEQTLAPLVHAVDWLAIAEAPVDRIATPAINQDPPIDRTIGAASQDISPTMSDVTKPLPKDNGEPSLSDQPNVPKDVFSAEQLSDQELDLWEQTEQVRQRFTGPSASQLISHWENLGDQAGSGSLTHAASRSLCLRAAWLLEDWNSIVERATALEHASEEIDESRRWFLSRSVTERLVASWLAARANVDRSEDLDQLLRGANRLLDTMICSQQTQWSTSWVVEVARLSQFASDEVNVRNWQELRESFEKAVSIDPQESKKQGRSSASTLGRVLCLQQRRWDEGLPSLAKSADRMLSSIAIAELRAWEETISVDDPERFLAIAKRWHNAASKYETRDAASMRLHALDLIDQAMQSYNDIDGIQLRQDCLAALPDYVR